MFICEYKNVMKIKKPEKNYIMKGRGNVEMGKVY
jgi:hypothetical protein